MSEPALETLAGETLANVARVVRERDEAERCIVALLKYEPAWRKDAWLSAPYQWALDIRKRHEARGQGDAATVAIERELLACLKDAHADCPGYEVSPAHDCDGTEESCSRRCPVEERTECQVCDLIARAGARQ